MTCTKAQQSYRSHFVPWYHATSAATINAYLCLPLCPVTFSTSYHSMWVNHHCFSVKLWAYIDYRGHFTLFFSKNVIFSEKWSCSFIDTAIAGACVSSMLSMVAVLMAEILFILLFSYIAMWWAEHMWSNLKKGVFIHTCIQLCMIIMWNFTVPYECVLYLWNSHDIVQYHILISIPTMIYPRGFFDG